MVGKIERHSYSPAALHVSQKVHIILRKNELEPDHFVKSKRTNTCRSLKNEAEKLVKKDKVLETARTLFFGLLIIVSGWASK